MASVIFRRNASSAYADAWCERTWQIPATGDAGQATITLPYSSSAASTTYIDPAGGSWVEIADEGGVGKWVGIVRELEYGQSDVTITAAQPQIMFGDRVLHWESTFRHAIPIGHLVGKVLRDVLPGMPWFWMRYPPQDNASDPFIRNYTFSGEDAWSALTDLMDQSYSELVIDDDTGEITWQGALSGDLRTTTLLIADGNLRDWSYRVDGSQRAAEVMVKRGAERFSVYSGTTAVAYSGQVTITAAEGTMFATAQDELARRTGAAITITGSVTSDLYGIRGRDYVRVVIPSARFAGAEHPCRVLSRAVSDDSPLMRLGLQVIDEAVGVRVAPPMRGASQKTSGAKGRGSFAQRQRSTQRQGWNAWLRDN